MERLKRFWRWALCLDPPPPRDEVVISHEAHIRYVNARRRALREGDFEKAEKLAKEGRK